jgi:hypothetical protein
MHAVNPGDNPYHRSLAAVSNDRQVRRAWTLLGISFALVLAVGFGLIVSGLWVYRHATVAEHARLTVISGSAILVRTPSDENWRAVGDNTRISEGDTVSTALGTVASLTMFDGSTVEIAEDTVVRVAHMRASRFLHRTKLIELEPSRGSVYVSMVPSGAYEYSETIVRDGDRRIVMSDDQRNEDSGSFLLEILGESTGAGDGAVRAAVLRGSATLYSGSTSLRLQSNQQTVVNANGEFGPLSKPVRELVENGNFQQGMDGWVEFEQRSPRQSSDAPTDASVDLVRENLPQGEAIAVEFLRGSTSSEPVQSGIRQRVGKTLRLHSSLLLRFDVKITDQEPTGGGDDLAQFPFIVKLTYIDVDGQEREWSHGYYVVEDPDHPVDSIRATRIPRDTWQQTTFDLRNLDPVPHQITTIVVYASGQSYQTRVTNISLTSGELVEQGP